MDNCGLWHRERKTTLNIRLCTHNSRLARNVMISAVDEKDMRMWSLCFDTLLSGLRIMSTVRYNLQLLWRIDRERKWGCHTIYIVIWEEDDVWPLKAILARICKTSRDSTLFWVLWNSNSFGAINIALTLSMTSAACGWRSAILWIRMSTIILVMKRCRSWSGVIINGEREKKVKGWIELPN